MNMKRMIIAGISAVIALAGILVWWGGSFATDFVHEQLSAQKIKFPSAEVLKADNPALVKYADLNVDNADTAKGYSEYISGHLQKVAGGKTYSEVSSLAQKDKTNTTLAAQKATLFQGETLRGLLLNAWGWGLIGMIALYASYALFALAAVGFAVAMLMQAKPAVKASKRK
jgi:hypothetical protein